MWFWFDLLNIVLLVIPNLINHEVEALDLKMQQNDYKIEFEWAELTRYNKRYLKYHELRTFKYNRTVAAMNISSIFNIDIGNEWENIIQAYKFASNEYRMFPLRFEVNFCTAVNKNYVGLGKIKNCGNFTCPPKKGLYYHSCNWVIDESEFPPLIPSGRYMVEIQGLYRDDEMYVQRYYGSVTRGLGKH